MSVNSIGGGASAFVRQPNADDQFMSMINQVAQTDPSKASMLMYQRMQEKEQELVSFISNIMKKMSEMNMTIINNMK